jgi:hypothetical protein
LADTNYEVRTPLTSQSILKSKDCSDSTITRTQEVPIESERSGIIEVDDNDKGVEYNREQYFRMVKLIQERKVVREGWVKNNIIEYYY